MFHSQHPRRAKDLQGLQMAFGYFSVEGTHITSAPKSLARLSHMDLPTEENYGYNPTMYPEGVKLKICRQPVPVTTQRAQATSKQFLIKQIGGKHRLRL